MNTFRYQKLYEDIYDMMKRRKIGWCELGFAIYLRGKALRFGNPFFMSNSDVCIETGTTDKIIRPLRNSLQVKGIIKFDLGNGKRHPTTYYMLDSVMTPQRVPNRERKGALKRPKGCPSGNPTIYNKEKNKEIKQNSFHGETYKGNMTDIINNVFADMGVHNGLRASRP